MPQGFQSLREVMVNGGPILFVLLLMSIALFALIIERVMSFRKSIVDQDWLTQQMALHLVQGKVKDALVFAEGIEGSLARVFEVGLKRVDEPREIMENAMKVAISRQSLLMEKNISTIATMAVVCPFVGLFGTVVGIMHAFGSIATKGGTGAAAVAGGVSEALITTAAGLFVAIAAVVANNYFRGKIKTALDEMYIHVEVFADMIFYVKEGKPFPQDLKEVLDLPVLGEAPGERAEASNSPYANLANAGPAAPTGYPAVPPTTYPPTSYPQTGMPMSGVPMSTYPQQMPPSSPGYPPTQAPSGYPPTQAPPGYPMSGAPGGPPPPYPASGYSNPQNPVPPFPPGAFGNG